MVGSGDRGVEVFNRDAAANRGYLYTNSTRLSSRLATRRSIDAILGSGRFAARSVLDIGCGDGFYTIRFWDEGQPCQLYGLDAAARAIEVATANRGDRPIEFLVGDSHALPFPAGRFDLALVQSILHHDVDPVQTIREALRVAAEIVIHEPNGNNPGLKFIEKTSSYHREHQERSYTSWQLAAWVERAGGRVASRRFAGFVPMFCPDWLARSMKTLEPVVERLPILCAMACAVSVLVVTRSG